MFPLNALIENRDDVGPIILDEPGAAIAVFDCDIADGVEQLFVYRIDKDAFHQHGVCEKHGEALPLRHAFERLAFKRGKRGFLRGVCV